MEWLLLIQVISAVFGLVKQGILGFQEVQTVFNKFKAIPNPTPADVEQMRNELLDLAKRVEPGKDPAVLEQLRKDGIDPKDIGLI